MIDIHLHILPGIDDGPATIEGSIATARRATEDGVTVVAATPHLRADHAAVRPHELAGRCEELQRALVEHGLALTVVPGGEVDLRWATGASDEDLRLVSYAQRGRHLLVETPYGDLDGAFEDRVFGLALRGYTLVLAHPERSPTFQRDPARVGRLVERGTLMQVTAMSLASAFTSHVKDTIDLLRATPEGSLLEPRAVGRSGLPSTVLGLFVHCAEHSMRHVGQLLVTARVVREASGQ